MRILICILLCSFAAHSSAAQVVELGCRQLRVALDERLTPDVLEKAWESGAERFETPAVLEWVDCGGRVTDRLVLAAPLARIDPVPVKGAKLPTFLVSVDLSADAGSYNGPQTMPFQLRGDALTLVSAQSGHRYREVIRLSQTGKSAWMRVSRGLAEDLLQVKSDRRSGGFVVSYKRYSVSGRDWRVREVTRRGLWESDQDFPGIERFPK